jgi:hypothetical protein
MKSWLNNSEPDFKTSSLKMPWFHVHLKIMAFFKVKSWFTAIGKQKLSDVKANTIFDNQYFDPILLYDYPVYPYNF